MKRDPSFHREFLTELKSLDDFLLRHHDEIEYVERADPDVRRIMEAMAFFAARSRKLAVDGFGNAVVRLARGHLDDLLHPQPTRALVQALPGDRVIAPLSLPAGTLLRATVAAGADAGTVGLLSTMRPLTVLPLAVHGARLVLRPDSGYRILIELRARAPIPNLDRPLPFHISYLGDYLASRQFLYAVEQHLVATSVVFGDGEPEAATEGRGQPCVVRFGDHPRRDDDAHPHPLAELTSFFHFPERELYFHVDLPSQESPWRRAWLCLDVDADWPAELVVNKDIFRLFVVPVENARSDLAEPIVCDGTQDGYPLRPPAPHHNDVLHSVIGAYQEVDSGWEPLLPEHLSPVLPRDAGTYEIEPAGEDSEPRILVRIPGAFTAPRKISVEARWYQPWFEARAAGRLDVTLQNRSIEGLRWQMHGRLRAHKPSRMGQKPFDMLHLLALMGRPVLSRDEIVYILRILGADDSSVHGQALDLIKDVHVTEQRSRQASGARYVYDVALVRVEDDRAALAHDLVSSLRNLLDAWSKQPIDVKTSAKQSRETQR